MKYMVPVPLRAEELGLNLRIIIQSLKIFIAFGHLVIQAVHIVWWAIRRLAKLWNSWVLGQENFVARAGLWFEFLKCIIEVLSAVVSFGNFLSQKCSCIIRAKYDWLVDRVSNMKIVKQCSVNSLSVNVFYSHQKQPTHEEQ